MNVREIMATEIVSCNVNEALPDVAKRMQQEDIGCCPVVDSDMLVGVLTDRDITVRAVSKGFDLSSMTVRDIMTPNPIFGDPSMSLEEAARVMADNQIRRLPIMESNRLVGMVALADLAIDLEEDEVLAETVMRISEPTH